MRERGLRINNCQLLRFDWQRTGFSLFPIRGFPGYNTYAGYGFTERTAAGIVQESGVSPRIMRVAAPVAFK